MVKAVSRDRITNEVLRLLLVCPSVEFYPGWVGPSLKTASSAKMATDPDPHGAPNTNSRSVSTLRSDSK